MERARLAEEKYRPLKRRMQATLKRLKAAAREGRVPEREVVAEFVDQVRIMVSYPGFGDAAYPEVVAASEALGQSAVRHDPEGFRQALADILSLQERCHNSPSPGGRGLGGGGRDHLTGSRHLPHTVKRP